MAHVADPCKFCAVKGFKKVNFLALRNLALPSVDHLVACTELDVTIFVSVSFDRIFLKLINVELRQQR